MSDDPSRAWKRKRIAAVKRVGVGSQWRHYRTGTVYTLENVAIREEDGELLVVYFNKDDGGVWCRPLAEFDSTTKNLETGETVQRFTRIEEPKR